MKRSCAEAIFFLYLDPALKEISSFFKCIVNQSGRRLTSGSFVLPGVLWRNALHAVDLDLDAAAVRHRVGHLVDRLLVHLHAVNGQTGARVKLLMAYMALEMLRFLMLDENLLVVELTITVP